MVADLTRRLEELRLEVHDALFERDAPNPMHQMLGMAGMFQGMQTVFEPLRMAIQHAADVTEKDAGRDQAVADQLQRTEQALQAHTQALERNSAIVERFASALEEFTQTMRTPKTRTAVVDLPEGQARMTITESRERK